MKLHCNGKSSACLEPVNHASLHTLAVVVDEQARIQAVNTAFEAWSGQGFPALQGRCLATMLEDGEVLFRALAGHIEDQHEWRVMAKPLYMVLYAHEMQKNWVVIECMPMAWFADSRSQDVQTGPQETQESSLVRNLAHEIKNPLGGIRGAAQLLQRSITDKEALHLTHIIIKEADRLQALVDSMLAPHRVQELSIAGAFNIHEVLERVRSILLAEYPQGLEVLRDYDASLPELYGSRGQMIQAVLNIARNASQAMAEKMVTHQAQLRLRTRVARHETWSGKRHALALDLHITDNGPGIPSSLMNKIFEPLVSGRHGGTGLGLTLVQSIIHQHGGCVAVQNTRGGADFRILLPLVIEKANKERVL